MNKTTKALFITAIIAFFLWNYAYDKFVEYCEYTEYYEMKIHPLYDDIYVLYNTNHSNVPSKNYIEVTVADEEMQYTYSGNAKIVFDCKNMVEVKTKPHLVNSDNVVVHVDKGAVCYSNSYSCGK